MADVEGEGHGCSLLTSRQLKVLCHTVERHWPSRSSTQVSETISTLQSSFPAAERKLLTKELAGSLTNCDSMDLTSVKGAVVLLYYKYFGDITSAVELEALQAHAKGERAAEKQEAGAKQRKAQQQDLLDGTATLAAEDVLESTVWEYLRLYSGRCEDVPSAAGTAPLLRLDREMPFRQLLKRTCAAVCGRNIHAQWQQSRLGAGRAVTTTLSQRAAPKSEPFGSYCPVSWVDSRKLVNGAGASTQASASVVYEYAGRVYCLANANAASTFIGRPEYYASSPGPLPALPSELPSVVSRQQVLASLRRMLVDQQKKELQSEQSEQVSYLRSKPKVVRRLIDLRGYCPVEWAIEGEKKRSLSDRVKPGTITRLVEFAGGTFALSSNEALAEFMQSPALFVATTNAGTLGSGRKEDQVVSKIDAAKSTAALAPAAAEAKAKLMTLPQVPSTFAPFTGSFSELSLVLLTDGLSRVHKFRPLLPGKTAAESALVHLALHMRAFNPAVSVAERVARLGKLERFEQDCEVLARLRSSGAWSKSASDAVKRKFTQKQQCDQEKRDCECRERQVAVAQIEAKTPFKSANYVSEHTKTELIKASENGEVEAVKALLEAGYSDINAQDQYGNTALAYAASYLHTGIVKRLLVAGADATLGNKESEVLEGGYSGPYHMLAAITNGGEKNATVNALTAAGVALPTEAEIVLHYKSMHPDDAAFNKDGSFTQAAQRNLDGLNANEIKEPTVKKGKSSRGVGSTMSGSKRKLIIGVDSNAAEFDEAAAALGSPASKTAEQQQAEVAKMEEVLGLTVKDGAVVQVKGRRAKELERAQTEGAITIQSAARRKAACKEVAKKPPKGVSFGAEQKIAGGGIASAAASAAWQDFDDLLAADAARLHCRYFK
jgi:hypothetical protein